MTALRRASAIVLLAGSAVTAFVLYRVGTPSTAYEWFTVLDAIVVLTSFATFFITLAWSIIMVGGGPGVGWSERYRQNHRLLLHGEEFKTERTIFMVSLVVYFAALCVGAIASTPSTAPIPSSLPPAGHERQAVP
ncbi:MULTISPECIES: hypothetical protein [unclassified Ensifer]|uniref:hypothetical protein n=1 Tax=unclassified Ensifer TaxID=2633371 RepID=UPI000812C9F1|nr:MULTISPECIES: hypothetical protein [unclassified Ensifer]OCP04395.1 hypothetical protein BBX50_25455 [Ensifer sp. LC11]OCP04675.1 hypothetical protein BC374_25475 [Ensifer sp. LC13]OCP13328.1 hypothetical protein BC362_05385 [Ensifer sp. LC14]OCP30499.1 hypothetical protein BC364_25490 [Ensifer sp. LC499]